MEKYIKIVPLFILLIMIAMFLFNYQNMSVLLVAIMCGFIPVSLMSAVYTMKVKKGANLNANKYFFISLALGLLLFLAVYYVGYLLMLK